MKAIFGAILILIGYLTTVISATLINELFGIFVLGVWVVILGVFIIYSYERERK